MLILPPRRKRETHQNTLDSRTRRIEPKGRSSIMHEIEFHISPSSQLLPLSLFLRIRHVLSLLYNRQIGRQESIQTGLTEGEKRFLIFLRLVQIIEEYPTDAA